MVVGDCILVGLQVILPSSFLLFQSYHVYSFHWSCSSCSLAYVPFFFFFFPQPILVYICKMDGKLSFNAISVNFLTEVAKVIFALIMLLIQVNKLLCFRFSFSLLQFTHDCANWRIFGFTGYKLEGWRQATSFSPRFYTGNQI